MLLTRLRFIVLVCFLILNQNAHGYFKCANCNILLISLDTVGSNYLGYNLADPKISPNIDELVKKSVLYQRTYATSSWTLPSHSSMLTGYSPAALHMTESNSVLLSTVPTLATILKENGYLNAAITDGGYVSEANGILNGFRTIKESDFAHHYLDPNQLQSFDESLNWINENKKNKFFLFVHSYGAHEPYYPTDAALKAVAPEYKGNIKNFPMNEIENISLNQKKVSAEDGDRYRDLYKASIHDVDSKIGDILKKLTELGLFKNTVIIVTSDHGQEFGEHGEWAAHATQMYEEVTKVPLVMYIPGIDAKEILSPVSLMDITPTILEIVGAKKQDFAKTSHGEQLPLYDSAESMKRIIFSDTTFRRSDYINVLKSIRLNMVDSVNNKVNAKSKRDVFADIPTGLLTTVARFPSASAVWSGDFKLIVDFDTQSFRLYNLKNDPKELIDISAKFTKKTEELKKLLFFNRL